jgi:hypothetical protein
MADNGKAAWKRAAFLFGGEKSLMFLSGLLLA